MSTEGTPQSTTAPEPPSSAPPSSTPASGPPAEFRFGNDIPQEWARGKSASEILNLAQQQANVLQGMLQGQPSAPAAPPPAPPALRMPTGDQWIVEPEVATRNVAESVIADKLTPMVQGMQMLAGQYASVVRMNAQNRYADDFRRYGPEIDALMAQAAPEQRTLENYEKVVTYIRGQHRDEFVREEAEKLIAQGGLGERSGGGGGVGTPQSGGLDFAKLPHGVGEIAKQKGLTEGMVRDYCKANHITTDDWMRMALNNEIVTSTAPFTFEVNEKTLGVNRDFGS